MLTATRLPLALTGLLIVAAGASAGFDYVENFDSAANPSGWTFGVTNPDVIQPTGGVSGDGWLQNDGIISFAPVLTAADTSAFGGDWQSMGVQQISITARTDFWQTFNNVNPPNNGRGRPGDDGRPGDGGGGGGGGEPGDSVFPEMDDFWSPFYMTVAVWNDNNTPNDPTDDFGAQGLAEIIPLPGEGWVDYVWNIDTSASDLPDRWTGLGATNDNFEPVLPTGRTFDEVFKNVTAVDFLWLPAGFGAVVIDWDAGVDSIRITSVPTPGAAALLGLSAFGVMRRRRA